MSSINAINSLLNEDFLRKIDPGLNIKLAKDTPIREDYFMARDKVHEMIPGITSQYIENGAQVLIEGPDWTQDIVIGLAEGREDPVGWAYIAALENIRSLS